MENEFRRISPEAQAALQKLRDENEGEVWEWLEEANAEYLRISNEAWEAAGPNSERKA